MDTFTQGKFASHPTELAMLKGARLVTASETEEGLPWAEARIKQLTGGDSVTARFMRNDFFTYLPEFKLLFAGNHQPTLNGVDLAMRRRFAMLPFVNKPSQPDPLLETKLKSESPMILAWMLAGCLRWQQERGLGLPENVQLSTQEYLDEQDVFGQWISGCCDIGPHLWETMTILFDSWSQYAKAAGEHSGTMSVFSHRLTKLGFSKVRTSAARKVLGIAVASRIY